MRRRDFRDDAEDDPLPVMVPRSDRVLVPMPVERVRRLRRHLVATLRATRKSKDPGRVVSGTEPTGFAARVAGTACGLCKGHCCKNGADDAFLDEPTVTRVRHGMNARAVLRLFVDRVPAASYQGSCIFHGQQGCTLDRSLRSEICNSYFCGGLQNYLKGGAVVAPAVVFAGEGDKMRSSRVLTPSKKESI